MDAAELREYTHKLNVEAENLEAYLMDVALYSDSVISYSELLYMPLDRVKLFEKRLGDKIKKKSGKSGTEYL